jgi:hypothetical protein
MNQSGWAPRQLGSDVHCAIHAQHLLRLQTIFTRFWRFATSLLRQSPCGAAVQLTSRCARELWRGWQER